MIARIALATLVVAGGVAHAGPVAAVKKRGFHHATLVAKGRVSVVAALDRAGDAHTLLVDRKGRVADAGDAGTFRGKVTVTVAPFFGDKRLLDVDVAWAWSNGMGANDGDIHYIVRAKGFAFACSFGGDSSASMEEAGSSTTSTIDKAGDSPLSWTVTSHQTRTNRGPGPDEDDLGGDQVTTYTLGATGPCATSP